jgi:hypothetical protein
MFVVLIDVYSMTFLLYCLGYFYGDKQLNLLSLQLGNFFV